MTENHLWFRICTIIGDYEESIPELKEWSESHEGKILITKASTYLSGASYAVYEGIGNEDKVSKKDTPICLCMIWNRGTLT